MSPVLQGAPIKYLMKQCTKQCTKIKTGRGLWLVINYQKRRANTGSWNEPRKQGSHVFDEMWNLGRFNKDERESIQGGESFHKGKEGWQGDTWQRAMTLVEAGIFSGEIFESYFIDSLLGKYSWRASLGNSTEEMVI